MNEQREVQKLLLTHLEERKLKNPNYSLRAFARFIGLGPSTLSEVLSGKRRVSRDAAEKIVSRLGLDPKATHQVLSLFRGRRQPRKKKTFKAIVFSPLDMDQYYLIADWYYFAILSLSETIGFSDDPNWIARRLQLTKKIVGSALNRLKKLGLLEADNQGLLRPSGRSFSTSDGTSSQAIRKNHHQTLDLAKQSLDVDPVDTRSFTAMTMAIDPELLPEAFERMTKFRDELCTFLESGTKKEVYKLSLQLFPLSKKKELI
jgi:uncharacterized protein (TIGR02147 family)